MLSKYQDVQNKARKEVLEFDKNLQGQLPNYNQIMRLDYLAAIIKETQRMYPIAPFIIRENLKEVEIKGHKIPPNVCILLLFFFIYY